MPQLTTLPNPQPNHQTIIAHKYHYRDNIIAILYHNHHFDIYTISLYDTRPQNVIQTEFDPFGLFVTLSDAEKRFHNLKF